MIYRKSVGTTHDYQSQNKLLYGQLWLSSDGFLNFTGATFFDLPTVGLQKQKGRWDIPEGNKTRFRGQQSFGENEKQVNAEPDPISISGGEEGHGT